MSQGHLEPLLGDARLDRLRAAERGAPAHALGQLDREHLVVVELRAVAALAALLAESLGAVARVVLHGHVGTQPHPLQRVHLASQAVGSGAGK